MLTHSEVPSVVTTTNRESSSSPMRCLSSIVFLFLLVPAVWAAGNPPVRSPQPKLVLVIVVDQMRSDYLTRFGDLFCEGGFNLLMKHGAMCTNCAYDYAATYTAPGHSTILSGTPIRRSGIIGNEWFDRKKLQRVYCVEDSSVRSLGTGPESAAGKMSPREFQGTTLGDQLLSVSPSSRVIGISIKDRGAILLAGQHPTGALWFDPGSGNWISSSYYFRALPAWVQLNIHFSQEKQKAQPTGVRTRTTGMFLCCSSGRESNPGGMTPPVGPMTSRRLSLNSSVCGLPPEATG